MKPSLLDLVGARALASWLVLIGATICSLALGSHHSAGAGVVVVVLGIAVIKMRLVGLDFMELRGAPVLLRSSFEIYCLLLWLALSGLYLWA